MDKKLEKLLVDWKVAGFVDSRKEWDAIVKYIDDLEQNEELFRLQNGANFYMSQCIPATRWPSGVSTMYR